MTTKAKTAAAPSPDLNTIRAALKLLGVKVQERTYPGMTEVFTVPPDAAAIVEGLKFTFRDGVLVGLHARNLDTDVDGQWIVAPDASAPARK